MKFVILLSTFLVGSFLFANERATVCPYGVDENFIPKDVQPDSFLVSPGFKELATISGSQCGVGDVANDWQEYLENRESFCKCREKSAAWWTNLLRWDITQAAKKRKLKDIRKKGIAQMFNNQLYKILKDAVKYDVLLREGFFPKVIDQNNALVGMRNCRVDGIVSSIRKQRKNLLNRGNSSEVQEIDDLSRKKCDISIKEFDERVGLLIGKNKFSEENLNAYYNDIKEKTEDLINNELEDKFAGKSCLPRKGYIALSMTPGGTGEILNALRGADGKDPVSLKELEMSLFKSVARAKTDAQKEEAKIALKSFLYTIENDPILSKAKGNSILEKDLVDYLTNFERNNGNIYRYKFDENLLKNSTEALGDECKGMIDGFLNKGYLCNEELPEPSQKELFNGLANDSSIKDYRKRQIQKEALCGENRNLGQRNTGGDDAVGGDLFGGGGVPTNSDQFSEQPGYTFEDESKGLKLNFNDLHDGSYTPNTDLFKDFVTEATGKNKEKSSYANFNKMFCAPFLNGNERANGSFSMDKGLAHYLSDNPNIANIFSNPELAKKFKLSVKFKKDENGKIIGLDLENPLPPCQSDGVPAGCDSRRIPRLSYKRFFETMAPELAKAGMSKAEIDNFYRGLESVTNKRYTAIEREFELAKELPGFANLENADINTYYRLTKNGNQNFINQLKEKYKDQPEMIEKIIRNSRVGSIEVGSEKQEDLSLFSNYLLHADESNQQRLEQVASNPNLLRGAGGALTNGQNLLYTRRGSVASGGGSTPIDPGAGTGAGGTTPPATTPIDRGTNQTPEKPVGAHGQDQQQQQQNNQPTNQPAVNRDAPNTADQDNQTSDQLDDKLVEDIFKRGRASQKKADKAQKDSLKEVYEKRIAELSNKLNKNNDLINRLNDENQEIHDQRKTTNNQTSNNFQNTFANNQARPPQSNNFINNPRRTNVGNVANRFNRNYPSDVKSQRVSSSKGRGKGITKGGKAAKGKKGAKGAARGIASVKGGGSTNGKKGLLKDEKLKPGDNTELAYFEDLYRDSFIILDQDFATNFGSETAMFMYLKLIGKRSHILYTNTINGKKNYILVEFDFRFKGDKGVQGFDSVKAREDFRIYINGLYKSKDKREIFSASKQMAPVLVRESCGGESYKGDIFVGDCLTEVEVKVLLSKLQISENVATLKASVLEELK